MINANIALARRFWMHVHEGGTLTTLDVGRMVTAMEEQDASFTNLHREYDRRGDRIEELEAKLAKAVAMALEECPFREDTGSHNDWWHDRRTTLAELTSSEAATKEGGKDE